MKRRDSGFSLLEAMIVIIIVLIVSATVFRTIDTTMQRSSGEQTKLDLFQESREFMDQMSLDLRQAGYPNPRNMDPAGFTQTPFIWDRHAAGGLIKVGPGDLWFEGDVEGSGTVSVVRYHLDSSTTNGCPCLKRSQLAKIDGHPLTGQLSEVYEVEVQGVLNNDIFSAFNNGNAVGLPVDTSVLSGRTIATVDTVQAMLTLQAAVVDPQTRRKPKTTLVTTVRLNNCSQAAIGFKTSCQ
jgi:prepilin-type N-terminal cleavage/methylation domain-containing protein